MTSTLHLQAQQFAENLSRTVQAVVGASCQPFSAIEIEEADAFAVRQEPADGIVLSTSEGPSLRLTADYRCILDGHGKYLAVDSARMHVFVAPDGREPLFRYEYERSISPTLPAAHIQFHGVHPELERALNECGDSTQRAKRRRRGKGSMQLSSLHFPVGGLRFRPVLEDVLEMLIEEFGVELAMPTKTARTTLSESRESWRRTQVATVVRDAPSEAVHALEEMGYRIDPPEQGPIEDRPGKLRAL